MNIASKDQALLCVLSLAEKHLPSRTALHTQTLKSIGKSLDEDGLGVRVHGNTRRLPKNSLSLGDLLPLFYCSIQSWKGFTSLCIFMKMDQLVVSVITVPLACLLIKLLADFITCEVMLVRTASACTCLADIFSNIHYSLRFSGQPVHLLLYCLLGGPGCDAVPWSPAQPQVLHRHAAAI